MEPELKEKLTALRLNGLLNRWDEILKTAEKGSFSYTRLLKTIVDEEYDLRQEAGRKYRIQRARIPEKYVIETYPFSRQPQLDKKMIVNLYDAFDYMTQHQNVLFLGSPGVGKTGLATSFLTHAMDRGYHGRFIDFSDLMNEVYSSVADHSQEKILKKYADVDCLLIDELGYVEVEPVQVGLFFKLMNRRYRKKTTLITSNLGFQEWNSFFKNDQLTVALIDRFTESCHIVNFKKCQSLRQNRHQS
jgi:DNA replication protein DnaC